MAEHCNLYDRAKYYDIIFDRDVSKEVAFVSAAFKANAGRELKSVIDVACGPGYHALAFAKLGLKAYGLDLRAEMLRSGAEKARKAGVSVEWMEADMRTFALDQPVDAAFVMFDGLDCLLSNDDLIEHFKAVGRNLSDGGIYIVDLSHPRQCSFGHYHKFHYSGEKDGIKVDIHWATNDPHYDLATGIARGVGVEMRVNDNGKSIVVQDAADERLLYPQEVNLLARLSGKLEVVGWYGNFDLRQPLDQTPASQRMIAVMRKVS